MENASAIVVLLFLALVLGCWAFFIWAGATLAENKGRSAWLGGLLGAFLGLLGLFIVFLLPANQRLVFERQQRWRDEYEGAKVAGPEDPLERWKREGMVGPPPWFRRP